MRLGKIVKGVLFELPKPYNDYMDGKAYSNLDILLEGDIALANQNGWYEIEEGEGEWYELENNKLVPKGGGEE